MLATVGGLVKRAARAAGAERPTLTTEIPHRSVDSLGLLATHGDEPATRGTVGPGENFLPVLASVRGLINTALVIVIPQVTSGADINAVTVLGIDQDLCNVLSVLQTNVGPVLSAVGGLVDPISNRNAVPHPRLASTDPNNFGVCRVNSDRPDRLHGLAVENRFERG